METLPSISRSIDFFCVGGGQQANHVDKVCVKTFRKLSAASVEELITPSAGMALSVMELRTVVGALSRDLPAESSVPYKVKDWLKQDEAVSVLRNGNFQQAFDEAGLTQPLEDIAGVDRARALAQQEDFVELFLRSVLNQCGAEKDMSFEQIQVRIRDSGKGTSTPLAAVSMDCLN